MDNLTHALAGAALGESGLKRLSGLGMAALIIGANIPDVDVLAVPFGESLTFRRGWTHGPLGLLVLPLLLTAALVAFDRWQGERGTRPTDRPPVRPPQLLLLAYIGAFSHPALDWLNTYGIRLLMPFSERWLYGDTLFIVDPWVWIALGLGVWLSRRLRRTLPARSAVALTALYVAAMAALTGAAERLAADRLRLAGGPEPRRILASPVPVDPLRRRILFDLGEEYRFGTVRWGPTPRVTVESRAIPTHAAHPAVAEAARQEPVADFLYWSRFPFFGIEAGPTGWRVHAADARYSSTPGDGWAGASAHVPYPSGQQP